MVISRTDDHYRLTGSSGKGEEAAVTEGAGADRAGLGVEWLARRSSSTWRGKTHAVDSGGSHLGHPGAKGAERSGRRGGCGCARTGGGAGGRAHQRHRPSGGTDLRTVRARATGRSDEGRGRTVRPRLHYPSIG